MIVSRDSFDAAVTTLYGRDPLAVDTETTGLRPYHGDKLFSIIIAAETEAFYFNFNGADDVAPEYVLDDSHRDKLRALFESSPARVWIFHNAKYDLAILRRAGTEVKGLIHDTMAMARVLDSKLFPNHFSLDECAKRIGQAKSDVVKKWILDSKTFTDVAVSGKKRIVRNLHYDKVPLDLIVPYAERDAAITFSLAAFQRTSLQALDDKMRAGKCPAFVKAVAANETKLTRTVFEMEERGVLIDQDFCRRAIEALQQSMLQLEDDFRDLTSFKFKDSAKIFTQAFQSDKARWVMKAETPTGKKNLSFDSETLSTFVHPAAGVVLSWRKAKSDINYYHGFLYEADGDSTVHASFNQHIAKTGRFSSSSPNLQNLTKDEDQDLKSEFVVRRAIVPRPGTVFHMLDYNQVEYRMMLDYAARFAEDTGGVLGLVDKILGGLDVHQAMADVAKITRREAKTVNFAILYGSGIASLSARLKVTRDEAYAIRTSIFRAAPEIDALIRKTKKAAEERQYIVNWLGRLCEFPDARLSYRALNYLIQGGAADVVKVAMNLIHGYLEPFATKMVLMIHDEIVLEGPPAEAPHVVAQVKKIMEEVYPFRFVPLTCGADHSFTSLADKKEGIYAG